MAEAFTSTSRHRNDEAWTSTFSAGTLAFGKAFKETYGDIAHTRAHEKSHLCIQQRQEERGSHSHPTHGTMETDKERRARANWYDDDGV